MNKSIALWATFLVSNALAMFWLYYFNVFAFVLSADITYISFGILALYLTSLVSIYFELNSDKSFEDKFENHMFISNHLPALGLLGTVIGLMYAVNTMAGVTIDARDQGTIMNLMSSMFSGLGTALVTTIVGLITSLVLKVQLIALDTVHKNEG